MEEAEDDLKAFMAMPDEDLVRWRQRNRNKYEEGYIDVNDKCWIIRFDLSDKECKGHVHVQIVHQRKKFKVQLTAHGDAVPALLEAVKDLKDIREEYEDGIRLIDSLKVDEHLVEIKEMAMYHFFAGLKQHVKLLSKLFHAATDPSSGNRRRPSSSKDDMSSSDWIAERKADSFGGQQASEPMLKCELCLSQFASVEGFQNHLCVRDQDAHLSLVNDDDDHVMDDDNENSEGWKVGPQLHQDDAQNGHKKQHSQEQLDSIGHPSEAANSRYKLTADDPGDHEDDRQFLADELSQPNSRSSRKCRTGRKATQRPRAEISKKDKKPKKRNGLKMKENQDDHEMMKTSQVEADLKDEHILEDEALEKEDASNNIKLECKMCKMVLSSPEALSTHFKSEGHIATRNERYKKRNSCTHCNRSFLSKANLKTHMMTHTGERPFVCEICSMSFYNKGNLKRHQATHSGTKSYKCDMCDKSYSHLVSLKEHKTVHTGEVLYMCTLCGKGFHNSGAFYNHKKTHGDKIVSKVFKCEECGKVMKNAQVLAYHQMRHKGVLPFECSFCKKAFLTKGQKKTHERIHNGDYPYECRQCDKRFYTKSNLRRHEITHVENKNFQCDICPKWFAAQEYLDTHKIVHNDQKFPCGICSKVFNTKPPMYKHRKSHFKDQQQHQKIS